MTLEMIKNGKRKRIRKELSGTAALMHWAEVGQHMREAEEESGKRK